MKVNITIKAVAKVPKGEDLNKLAARIKSQGLGPEDSVEVTTVLIIPPKGQGAIA